MTGTSWTRKASSGALVVGLVAGAFSLASVPAYAAEGDQAELSIVASANPERVYGGGEAEFSSTLTNTGDVPLTIGIWMPDALTDISCDLPVTETFSGQLATDSPVAPGDSLTCTGTYTTTFEDLNAGTVSLTFDGAGQIVDGTTGVKTPLPVRTTADLGVFNAQGKTEITAIADVTEAHVGETVTYTITHTNTGNVPLDISDWVPVGISNIECNVPVTQTPYTAGSPSNPIPVTVVKAITAVDVGDSLICTGTHVVTEEDVAKGTVTYMVNGGGNYAKALPFPLNAKTPLPVFTSVQFTALPAVVVPPTVTTKATSQAKTGEGVVDVAEITGDVPEGAYLLFDIYVWDGQDERPADAHFTGTEKVSVNGAGEYTSPEYVFTEPGEYQWFATLYNADGEVIAEDQWGVEAERTTVEEPVVVVPPTVTTKATSQAKTGEGVVDVAEITGDVPSGAYLLFDIYVWDGQDERPADAHFTGTEKVSVNGAGEYTSPEYVFTEPGEYQWFATLYNADGEVIAEDQWGVEAERTTVEEPVVVVPPTVNTKATSQAKTGEGVVDVAEITGDVPSGAYLLFDIYVWDGQDERPADAHFTGTEKVSVNGAGEYTSPEYVFTEPGEYQWFATLYNADGEVIAEDQWGVEAERTTVEEPVVVEPTPEPTEEPTPEPTTTPTPSTPTLNGSNTTGTTGGSTLATTGQDGAPIMIGALSAVILLAAGALLRIRRSRTES